AGGDRPNGHFPRLRSLLSRYWAGYWSGWRMDGLWLHLIPASDHRVAGSSHVGCKCHQIRIDTGSTGDTCFSSYPRKRGMGTLLDTLATSVTKQARAELLRTVYMREVPPGLSYSRGLPSCLTLLHPRLSLGHGDPGRLEQKLAERIGKKLWERCFGAIDTLLLSVTEPPPITTVKAPPAMLPTPPLQLALF